MTYIDRSFYDNIAMGGYSNIKPWSKIGYNTNVNTTEQDLWGYGATTPYVPLLFATTTMYVVSDSANDTGTQLYTGTSTGGSTTSLIDSEKNFTTPTPAAIGDIVILDPTGTTPEWGYVTGLTGNTQIDVAGGFSLGGSGNSRNYIIVDNSASTGAQVIKIEYLDGNYSEKSVIVCTNGTSEVSIKNDMLRINSFRVVGVGSNNKSVGNIKLKEPTPSTVVYSYIAASFTRARNALYTVPAGKTLYVNEWNVGWSTPNDTKVESARFYTRVNAEPSTLHNTGNLFYAYTETIITNSQITINYPTPTKIKEKNAVKITGVSFTGGTGAGASVLRGFLVTN